MAKKRTGLGKGLGALIVDTESPVATPEIEGGIQEVAVKKISSNPRQPRTHFNEDELAELADSIREHGVIQPLIISPNGEGKYSLIAGERRLKASQQAGLKKVPVVIREVSEQQQLEWALIENVQRADLSPLEEAEAYHQLTDEFGLSHAEIAKQVGKSRVAITNRLRLRKLSETVKAALIEKLISEGHARALLGLPTLEAQESALKTVTSLQLNVRQTEQLVNKWNVGKTPTQEKKTPKSPEVTELEDRLRSRFETKVSMRHSKKGGNITLYYASNEDLDALLEKLL
ncbi:MAG: ParB/RepB/Spo0J family partition protein [Anaerolineae bacterium]|jgi:ParB family chromosome partitioning protein|nr:ParB/RepB/Spo0J family partition protein [Anaerolineae bacterium]MBT4310033.1 ParB/RepB/Spo0J family partition protein [Anaerolineae bacterium]MBT4457443.1 ParB/RepB/Spo0J family partition protein [Anaerolineae bacterium]MBT4843041.1 ParB/RepB/Spo0J family partition protein [Anaerolineae bacterium]MBT6061603.1 ParB/RepB/Spo0J family partition protein [Anaerolineae bacterium]